MRFSRSLSVQAIGGCTFVVFSSFIATAQTKYVPARVTRVLDTEDLVTLRGHTHPLAQPEYDRGPAPDDLPMGRMLLVLQRAPEQETALRQLLDDQQVRSSPNFHQWLTPEQFGGQFGPADTDVQAVTDWLTAQGFQVNRVAAGRTVIEFSGTAGLVREALQTEIHKFMVNGEEHWANASDPQIPAALAPVVAGFASLNNFPRKHLLRRLGTFRRSKATGEVTPLFTFTPTGQSTFYALGPADLAIIYNVQPLWSASKPIDGTGQTIAVVEDSNINLQDVRDFRNIFGLSPNDPQVIVDGPDPGLSADEIEANLDVQWAGAVAKNATVDVVVAESTETSFGGDLASLHVVDNNVASVLSASYGICEASLGTGGNAFYNNLWEQASAQGITVIVASGDQGSAACDVGPHVVAAQYGLAVSGTASTPFNVALGGTDFDDAGSQATYWNTTNASTTQASAKSYIPETTWNDSCAQSGLNGCTPSSRDLNVVAGGGGPSQAYAKPSWQTGAGVPNDGVRDIPDVSLFASDGSHGSFYIVCQADQNADSSTSCNLNAPYVDFQGVGGTSASTPVFAGIMALVNQKTGERQGNANYVLYKLAAQKGASCASNAAAVGTSSCIFYDVIKGNDSVACVGGSPNCSNTNTAANQFGIVVDPKNSASPAWTTTAGYDRSTGLGSVNAANLVNNWTSVSFEPSTTSLTLSPTTITHGQPVNVTARVTSKSGTPTGAVALLGGPNNAAQGIGAFPLSNGTATGTTNLLPGGTYHVRAHFAGDQSFGASDSTPPIQVTVSKEGSKTQAGLVTFDYNTGNVTSFNAPTAAYGSPYVLRVNVTNNSGQPCASNAVPCPTGQVTLTDNGKPLDLGNYILNSQGYFEDQPIQLAVQSHSIAASYAGDNSYQPSASSLDLVSITKGVTAASVTANPSPVPYGSTVTLTATVNTESNGVAPTGTVQFLSGATALNGTVTYTATNGLPTPPATLQATLTTLLSATANVTVKYSGDGNYLTSASTPLTVMVTPGFTLSANPANVTISASGQSGNASLAVTSGPGFTGTVNLSCVVPPAMVEATCSVNPSSLSAAGAKATLTVTTTAPHTVAGLDNGPNWLVAGAALVLSCLLSVGIPAKRRRRKVAFGLLVFALVAAAFGGCGGGGSSGGGGTMDPGTPAGTYTVTVTATSGTISHTVNVSVTVA